MTIKEIAEAILQGLPTALGILGLAVLILKLPSLALLLAFLFICFIFGT